jgi:hypothetical protein
MSGFLRHDYVLTFEIADPDRRRRMQELCREELDGDEITPSTWEVSTELDPDGLEKRLLAHLADEDRAAVYYLSDSKRIFRVDLR